MSGMDDTPDHCLTLESAPPVTRFPAVPLDLHGEDAAQFRANPVPSCSDPACTAVEAHLRFAAVPVRVRPSGNVSASPTGALPAVCDETTGECFGADPFGPGALPSALRNYLGLRGYDLDAWLSVSERREVAALSALVDRLHRATLFNAWMEPANYRCVTRPSVSASENLPFPLGRMAAWNMKTAIAGVLGLDPPRGRLLGLFSVTLGAAATQSSGRGESQEELGQSAGEGMERSFDDVSDSNPVHGRAWARLYSDCVEAYRVLEERLTMSGGGKEWMLGGRPCSLDALVFAHVRHQLLNPVPVCPLRDLAQRHPRLVSYVERVATKYPMGSASSHGGLQLKEDTIMWETSVQRALYAARQATERARKRAAQRRKRWENGEERRAMFNRYRWIFGAVVSAYALIPVAQVFFAVKEATQEAERLIRRNRMKEAELDWRLNGEKAEDMPGHLIPKRAALIGTGLTFRYPPKTPGKAVLSDHDEMDEGEDEDEDDEDEEHDDGLYDDE